VATRVGDKKIPRVLQDFHSHNYTFLEVIATKILAILQHLGRFLWPPCVADADIIFLPCGFFYLLLLFFISSPNLSRRRLDVYHTFHTWCGISANLECRSEMCCTRLAGNAGYKNLPKIDIWAPSHNSVGLYLRN